MPKELANDDRNDPFALTDKAVLARIESLTANLKAF